MKYRPKGFLLLLIKVVLYAKVSIVCFFLIRLMLAFFYLEAMSLIDAHLL